MKKYLSLGFLLVAMIGFAQTHRYLYNLTNASKDKPHSSVMVLDIDKNDVKFYDYQFITNDSLSKKSNGNKYFTNTQTDQLLKRKINTFNNTTYHDNMFDYFSIQTKDPMTWKVEKETKKSGEYTLQKATTTFGGRNWISWFCPAIPFQEGPYKFRGLPGLIFELNDSENIFTYNLSKSFNYPQTYDTTDFLETHYGKKPLPVTLAQYHKVKLDYYNNPVAEMKGLLAKGGTITINSEKITTQEQLDQKVKFIQGMIRSSYTPIEKDKAIPYPAP